ncbi:N-acetylmuramic acid 6-phosphate etherase [Bacillaceae bacterium W0354]
MDKLTKLTTESYNPKSTNLDELTTREVLTLMNEEDKLIPLAIKEVLPKVEDVVHTVYKAFKKGGRLFYVGAGTSGRIGLLDAVECPPTFSTPVETVQAVIAGGNEALLVAVEGAEDDAEQGKQDLIDRHLNENDVVIGIAASGRTPYVKGALAYGQKVGAATVSLTSNLNAEISEYADYAIEVVTGPEILTGSTRLKAATAHKMILNMISTASMVKLGKVYNNFMVDLSVSNYKLRERAKAIVSEITDVTSDEAAELLEQTNYAVKPAIVMALANLSYEEALLNLERTNGYVKEAIKLNKS